MRCKDRKRPPNFVDQMEWPTVPELTARLKALRLQKGLTQEGFAEASGISYKYYQAVELGLKKDLRLSTIIRLARAHGMEAWQLLKPDAPASTKPGRRPAP